MRGSLLLSAGSLGVAGVVPGIAAAAAPLVLAGASGTVVECVGTEVLQRSLPDRVRAFSLGLADSVMVLAALLGALFVVTTCPFPKRRATPVGRLTPARRR